MYPYKCEFIQSSPSGFLVYILIKVAMSSSNPYFLLSACFYGPYLLIKEAFFPVTCLIFVIISAGIKIGTF